MVLSAWLLSCGSARAPGAASAVGLAGASSLVRLPPAEPLSLPGSLFPPLSHAELGPRRDSGKNQVWIHAGVRAELSPLGVPRSAAQWFPIARSVEALEIPARLGHGWLFAVSSTSDTWLFRAASFSSELHPLGRVPRRVTGLTVGLSGVFLALDDRASQVLNLDTLELTLAPLTGPPPSAQSYAALSERVALWLEPFRGPLSTHDAGRTWQPFGRSVERLELQGDHLLLRARGEDLLLGIDGELQPAPRRAAVRLEPPFRSAFDRAVERGVTFDERSAYYVERAELRTLSLETGLVTSSTRLPLDWPRDCTGRLVSGSRAAFVCLSPATTTLFVLESTGKYSPVAQLTGPRRLVASSESSALLEGSCRGSEHPLPDSRQRSYCLVPFGSVPSSVALSATAVPALFADGEVAGVTPPEGKHAGVLELPVKQQRFALKPRRELPAADAEFLGLANLAAVPNGDRQQLEFWGVTQGDFGAIRIERDGGFDVGPVLHQVRLALFAERRALVLLASDRALETLDHGAQFTDVQVPVGLSKKPEKSEDVQQFGCSSVGCRLGAWRRVGWQSSAAHPVAFTVVEAPKRLLALPGSAPRERLVCRLLGPSAGPPMAGPAGADRSSARTSLDTGALDAPLDSLEWRAFYGQRAPKLGPGYLGFDRGVRNDRGAGRLYARLAETSSGLHGELRLRFVDHLSSQGIDESIAPQLPFASLGVAARLFGHPRYGTLASPVSLELEPGGFGGVIRLGPDDDRHYWLFEAGRALQPLTMEGSTSPGPVHPVRLTQGWYWLSDALYALDGQGGRELWRPSQLSRASSLELTRDDRAGALAVVVRSTAGKSEPLLYPFSPATGAFEAPLQVNLKGAPRVCEPFDHGWLLNTSVSSWLDASGLEPGEPAPARVFARIRVSAQGSCLERLTLYAADDQPLNLTVSAVPQPRAIPAQSIDPEGRRRALQCAAAAAWVVPQP